MNEIAYMIKGKQIRMEMGQRQNTGAIIYQPENDETIGDDEQLLLLATKIEEKALNVSLFEISAKYRDMSSLMKQLQNRN